MCRRYTVRLRIVSLRIIFALVELLRLLIVTHFLNQICLSSDPLLDLEGAIQMLIDVWVRRWLLGSTVKYGRDTHIGDVLHVSQVYFACRRRHIWSLKDIFHFGLLVSGNKIIMRTLCIEPILFRIFLWGR